MISKIRPTRQTTYPCLFLALFSDLLLALCSETQNDFLYLLVVATDFLNFKISTQCKIIQSSCQIMTLLSSYSVMATILLTVKIQIIEENRNNYFSGLWHVLPVRKAPHPKNPHSLSYVSLTNLCNI